MNLPDNSDPFAGGGMMGALMRSMDWSKTAVGPVECWPQSLKTILSLCLCSKSPMFVWWGPKLTVFYNDAYIPIAGPLKHPQFLGAPAREQWAEVWDKVGPLTDQVTQTAAAVLFEDFFAAVIRRGFSEEAYFTFSYTPIRDESGGVCGVFGACQETTKRVLGERRLRNLRELGNKTANSHSVETVLALTASTLSENPSDLPFALIYLIEGRDLILKANTGTACNEQSIPHQILLADETSALSQAVSRTLREQKPTLVEEPMSTLGDFACSPLPEPLRLAVVVPISSSDQEKPAGVLIVGVSPRLFYDEDYQGYIDLIAGQIATSVSAARAILEVGKLKDEAVEQAVRMNSIFMQAPFAICVLEGPEHIMILSNQKNDEIVQREVLGKKIRDAFTEAEVGTFITILNHTYQTGEPYIANETIVRMIDSKGSARDHYVDFTYIPVRDFQGRITGIIILAVDVTDRVLSRKSLEDIQQQLRAAIQIKDDFIATLSHELRTPITSILSWSQLIQKMKFDPDKLAHGIKVIEQSAKTQTQLIDDLLDITRIQSGKLSINFTEISPSEPVLSSIEAVRPLADVKQIVIELQIKTQSETIWADSARLQQVMRNLLTNAVNFSPKGSVVRVSVEAVEEQGDPFMSIKVIDSGKGLSPEFLPKLFERFSQADSSSVRVHGGLGLGLAIVRDLVTLQGGSVRAESEGLGKGATFTVLLPIKAETSGQTNAITSEISSFKEQRIQRNAPANLSGLNVMIVEDDPKSLEVLSQTLIHFGAKTFPYSSVREALAAFEKLKPDVLVSDISMPIEDGYSLIQKVRKLGPERGGDVPSLALTALATPEDAQRALLAGFDSHMAKPFDMVRLGHVVAALAKQRKDARC